MIEVLFISAHMQLLPCVRIGSAFFLRASRNIRITVGTETEPNPRSPFVLFRQVILYLLVY